MIDTARARWDLVRIAGSYAGVGMTESPELYLGLIADGETPERAEELARESGCGLTVRGLWREWGCADRRLEAPYHNARAISDLVAMAREAGAWRGVDRIGELAPGDAIIVEGPEHILTVVELCGEIVHSIDGGQRDVHGAEAIHACARRLAAGHLDARPVLGWISWPDVADHFLGRREEL